MSSLISLKQCFKESFSTSLNGALSVNQSPPSVSDIIQLFRTFLGNSQNYQPGGSVHHLMNYRPRPKVEDEAH